MDYFCLVLLVVVHCNLSLGLRCLRCDDATSDAKCEKMGKEVECEDNQGSCQTEIRYHNHNLVRINKRCKQTSACYNDTPQVYHFGVPVAVECTPGKSGEVCRCCCHRDGCNGQNSTTCSATMGCLTQLRKLEQPGHNWCSAESCPAPQSTELREPKCKLGKNERPPVSLAAARQRLDLFKYEPTCRLFDVGMPAFKTPRRFCTDRNKVGSSCRVQCPHPYHLVGRSYITCRKKNRHVADWSWRPPCCAKFCPPFGNMDLMIGVESSRKVSERVWRRTMQLIRMTLGKFSFSDMRVGLFRYSDKVDHKTAIPLDQPQTRKDLMRDIYRLPAKPDDTMQRSFAAAFRHVLQSPMVKERLSNKRQIFLLFANGPANDVSKADTFARWLTDLGVQVMGVSVSDSPKVHQALRKQLFRLTRDMKLVYQTSVADLLSTADVIVRMLCHQLCPN